MIEKASDFDEFLVTTILADIFDPSGSDDFNFVSKKIVDGLESKVMIKSYDFDNKAGLAA